MEKSSLIFTTDSCIGCSKCIKGCPSLGANTAIEGENGSRIVVDGSKCIHCGSCLKNCEHDARRFTDDISEVMSDLENGQRIVLMIAPSFFLIYPTESKKVVTKLRKLGFLAIYDVSFGANITTWASVKYMKETGRTGFISSACPVVVDYIEKYRPSLIPQLIPVMSPAGCLMTYLKNFVYNKEEDKDIRYAFLGPCLGKHDEYSSYSNGSKMDYTFTYKSLYSYFCSVEGDRTIYVQESECDRLDIPGLGKLYPVPGGLRSNIVSLIGSDQYIKQIEGPNRVYRYFDTYQQMLKKREQLPYFIDVLNCEGGCSEGVATDFSLDDAEVLITKISSDLRQGFKDSQATSEGNSISPEERWNNMDEVLSRDLGLDLNLFMRSYNTDNTIAEKAIPQQAIDEIFRRMNKLTPQDQCINCTSCGYSGCLEMAKAIYFGYNTPDNCVHYIKNTLIDNNTQLEKLLATISGDTRTSEFSHIKTEELVQQIATAMMEVENQREELNNALGARTQMFANLTHELRTPLNAIINMTDLLDTSNFSKEQKENVHGIKTASNGLMDTINEILDFSKMEAGKFNIVNDDYYLHDLLSEVVTVMSFRCLEKKLVLECNLDHSLPDALFGDFKRIRQVMINLIGNAVKYTSLGSVSLSATWNHDKENPVFIFSVTDTGMGIKSEDIPFLFDSYKQVNETETKHIVGTGLGLSISKNILDAMGGTISVESEYGSGSKFTVYVPQKVTDFTPIEDTLKKKTAASETEGIKKDAFVIPSYRVLIVDDLPVNLHVARTFLDKYQIYVDIAESGKEALQKCAALKYDIIMMDQQMPEMSGLETVRELKLQNGINVDTPIVYMSAQDEATFVSENAADMIFQGYVEKPVRKEELEKTLLSLADESKVIYNSEGYIPDNDALENAVVNKDYDEYLNLIAALERYAQKNDPGRTLRLANKYRIMLQLGMTDIPVNNLSVLQALCNVLRKKTSEN